jgi:menaquinone-dependent protoporphyrinogen oxidase
MSDILILYHTTDGHTLDICECLSQEIAGHGHLVTLLPIKSSNHLDISTFDKIVIGASIRYGKHHQTVYEFIRRNQSRLEQKPNAFFSVNVVARKPNKNQPETNPYLKKFLRQISWKPRNLAVFAGMIDYQKYSFWDRNIIRLIMWMTRGPTDPTARIDFTDWKQVRGFAEIVSEM